jgi:hypothetical protein
VINLPFSLDDFELDQLKAATRPLAERHRGPLLRAVIDAYARCGERGPGTLHRIIVEQQRKFYDPPWEGSIARRPK